MFSDIFSHFLTQILFTVGVVVVFGLIIALARRIFCYIIGPSGPRVLLATGIVGTPIHELSHALMCIVFFHRITEMKLYDPNAENGVLGYVSHTYNPRNLYHQIGNFFIGVAPIICGSGVLLLLMKFMLPEMFADVFGSLTAMESVSADIKDIASQFFAVFVDVIKMVFDFSYANTAVWWIFIILALMISSHMEISSADIKSGIGGLFFLCLALLAADAILYFVDYSILEELTYTMTGFSAIIIGFLGISAIFSAALIVIGVVVRIISTVLGR